MFLASPGDLTDAGRADQYDILRPYLAGLPFPFLATMGNHDVMTGPDTDARDRFCRRIGVDAPSYRRLDGSASFAFLSTDGNIDGCEIRIANSAGILREALAGGDGPLFVFCHAPLLDTVDCAPGRSCFRSNDPGFGLAASPELRAMIRAAGRTVIWISGHVHAPLDARGLFHTERMGDAVLHSVSLSCPFFTGRDFHQDEPAALFHFTLEPHAAVVHIEDAETGGILRTQRLEYGR
jgi:hypothetical protein